MSVKSKEFLRAPFPWFGGKTLAASMVWERLGTDINNYIEPFFGGGAILLNAPEETKFVATINDIDAHVANFWRAIAADPDAVANYANSQVNEVDLQARHQYLVDNAGVLAQKLKADPHSYDPMLAGWWAWGCCCWIGSGWCAPKERVNKKLPHLVGGRGVNRQLPFISRRGQGVNRKLPHLGDAGKGVNREDRNIFLSEWFHRLSGKFTEARVTCGDWQRICTVSTMLSFGVCGVVLDPPYGTTGAVYAHDSTTVAQEVQDWCVENGSNPGLRIALCGHVGQHEILEALGWTVASPQNNGGYQGADDRERIWFSPGCLSPKLQQKTLFDLNYN